MTNHHDSFRIVARTIAGPDRRNARDNQDAYQVSWVGNILVAAVSDGVSASAHGGLASRIGVAAFLSHVRDDLDEISTLDTEGLCALASEAAFAAHGAVTADYPGGKALATLVVAMIDPIHHHLVVVHAGDSLAYFHHENAWQIPTKPHIRSVPLLQNGRKVIKDGVLIMQQGITRCLGAESFGVDVESLAFDEGDVVVLCTDGVPPEQAKQITAATVWRWTDEAAEKFVNRAASDSGDDATFVAVGLGKSPHVATLETTFANYESLDDAGRNRLIAALETETLVSPELIKKCYETEADETRQLALFGYISTQYANKTQLAALADKAGKEGKRQLLNAIVSKLKLL